MDLASHCLLLTNDVLSVSGYDVVNNSVLTLRAMGSKMVKANLPSLFLMTLTESCLQEREVPAQIRN
jgi:hypothetical protein